MNKFEQVSSDDHHMSVPGAGVGHSSDGQGEGMGMNLRYDVWWEGRWRVP